MKVVVVGWRRCGKLECGVEIEAEKFKICLPGAVVKSLGPQYFSSSDFFFGKKVL
jgi:hypothetical protein